MGATFGFQVQLRLNYNYMPFGTVQLASGWHSDSSLHSQYLWQYKSTIPPIIGYYYVIASVWLLRAMKSLWDVIAGYLFLCIRGTTSESPHPHSANRYRTSGCMIYHTDITEYLNMTKKETLASLGIPHILLRSYKSRRNRLLTVFRTYTTAFESCESARLWRRRLCHSHGQSQDSSGENPRYLYT